MTDGEHTVQVGGHRLRLSNLDKTIYPASGTTKAEVIDYYSRIAPALLPHVAGRPVTRKRWPEGTGEEPFFAKDLEAGAPAWIPRRAIEHSTGAKKYPLVDDVATLVYLAQVASLELHTPQWRFDEQGERRPPDRLVLDLDPGPGVSLGDAAQVAVWAKEILDGAGLVSVPVTSGSKGIHLYAPLDGTLSSADASALAKELARSLEADHGDLVTSTMARAQRTGKVFIDWSQNNGSKTTVAPYSLRGLPYATVAAPRTWQELASPNLAQLTPSEVLDAVADRGDPLAAILPSPTDALEPYRTKRRRDRTPEPFPAALAASSATPDPMGSAIFVVQEHHARRLHYDLRLERDGVLVSWAVPRGLPTDPDRNHLAVMTEPHPLEYATFSGEIPAGEYGAGHMSIWDSGTYRAEKWRDDEIIFTLLGSPNGPLGTARFALIRTGGDGEKSSWLLHRMALAPGSAPHAAEPHVTEPEPAQPSRTRVPPMLASASDRDAAAHASRAWSPWIEFKWDGVRALLDWDGSRMRLWARSGTDITDRYPELTALDLGATPLRIDGEIVALDRDGRPDFGRLQRRMHLTSRAEIAREATQVPVALFAFDLLRSGSDDLTGLPLRSRRERLQAALTSVPGPLSAPDVVDDLDDALAAATELRLEGVVVKDPASTYRSGRSDRWLKVKLTQTQDVVIGGIRRPRSGERGFASLLVGTPDGTGMHYLGRVGSGFSDSDVAILTRALAPLGTDVCPFPDVPADVAADAVWVEPVLVGEVEFADPGHAGHLRHARWRGLRSDQTVADLRAEAD